MSVADKDASKESDMLSGAGSEERKEAAASGLLAWLLLYLLSRLRVFISLFKPGRDMSVGARSLKVVRLLAEGGFSFVYVVEHVATAERFALKKVLAADSDAVEATKWEVSVHNAFSHPNLMPLIDHCFVAAQNQATEFRLLMPLYGGSLHDRICLLLQRGEHLPEVEALRIFAGILRGLQQFHTHAPVWAHRDIKPANVLLGAGDVPVLMDFGSTKLARVKINSRTKALLLQEDAAQNCSMAYRAPELWDPPSDAEIDERTDVWSLGCSLYAMCFYFSPFESIIGEDDQPRVCDCSYLRVIAGLQFPKANLYSEQMCELIRWMLTVDKDQRPFVPELQERVAKLLAHAGGGAGASNDQWANAQP
ncbi:kinase-like domain-containing protein [Pavlovales sp. CCMP2436]|nr:kinase-like domain-containing protein [Pavlovales sp. CCMP2436]